MVLVPFCSYFFSSVLSHILADFRLQCILKKKRMQEITLPKNQEPQFPLPQPLSSERKFLNPHSKKLVRSRVNKADLTFLIARAQHKINLSCDSPSETTDKTAFFARETALLSVLSKGLLTTTKPQYYRLCKTIFQRQIILDYAVVCDGDCSRLSAHMNHKDLKVGKNP